MTQAAYLQIQEEYPDQYIATERRTGRVLAHSPSIRKLYVELRRRRIALRNAVLEKVPPRNVVVIY